MKTSPLLAYFGQHCENSQGSTLMTDPPHNTVYPTKAWSHLLFELWRGTFIHISDEIFCLNWLLRQQFPYKCCHWSLLVPFCPETWQFKTSSSVLLFAQIFLFISRAQNPILKRQRRCLSIRHKHTLNIITVLAGNNVVSWAAVINVDECAPAFLDISQMQSKHSKLSFTPWLLNSQPSETEQDWAWGWSSDLEIAA